MILCHWIFFFLFLSCPSAASAASPSPFSLLSLSPLQQLASPFALARDSSTQRRAFRGFLRVRCPRGRRTEGLSGTHDTSSRGTTVYDQATGRDPAVLFHQFSCPVLSLGRSQVESGSGLHCTSSMSVKVIHLTGLVPAVVGLGEAEREREREREKERERERKRGTWGPCTGIRT